MFERFTPEARQIIVLAIDEARALRHGYVGTEHILLGLLKSGDPVASPALGSAGLTGERVRSEILRLVGEGDDAGTGQLPFTPRAKAALELALRESERAGAARIQPRHLLLGVAGEGEGVGARLLREADVDLDQLRRELNG